MLNDFISQTATFLQKSNLRIHEPELRQIIFNDEKNKTILIEMFTETYEKANITDNIVLTIILFFSVIDAKIDTDYPNLEGNTFFRKYQTLPKDTDDQIIFSQIFRILKALRNASVHSRTSLTMNDNNLICSYSSPRGTPVNLVISKTGIEIVFSLVLQLLNPIDNYRHQSIRRTFYDDIKAEINSITDEFGQDGLLDISDELRLMRSVRYQIENSTHNEGNDMIEITRIFSLDSETQKFQACDYNIELYGDRYLIPSEILNSSNKFPLNELTKWKS